MVEFTGGFGSHVFVRRERPHLVLGVDRAPIALSNGASPDHHDPLSMCFTLVQPIKSKTHGEFLDADTVVSGDLDPERERERERATFRR